MLPLQFGAGDGMARWWLGRVQIVPDWRRVADATHNERSCPAAAASDGWLQRCRCDRLWRWSSAEAGVCPHHPTAQVCPLLFWCQTPSKTQTDGRTDRRRESNLVHFSLTMWHLVAIILMIFLIISWPNFLYLLVDPGFLSPPLKFLWSIAVRSSRRMDAPDRHNGQRYVSVRSFVRLLNGVWRKLIY